MSSEAAYENVGVAAEDEDLDLPVSDDDREEGAARGSEDVRTHDQETLGAEEEAERLLGGEKQESRVGNFMQRRNDRRAARRQRRRGVKSEKSEVMYDMEQGGRTSSASSSESDTRRMGERMAKQKKSSTTSRIFKFTGIHLVILAAFLALLYGAHHASTSSSRHPPHPHPHPHPPIARTLSNGTHTFAPTTLLISLDGFRADFLSRGLTPTLNTFIRSGVSPRYMRPCFPSLTFPNHFTLVTGLHPESHGVVGNTFWDPNMGASGQQFTYGEAAKSMQPEWWNAEPLWLTAELAGVRSAIHMWPGSEAHIGSKEPTYVDEFNAEEELERKVRRIFDWLDLPGFEDEGFQEKEPRPQFIAAYVPDVDADGHKYGPNSTYIRSTIKEVDGMLASIFSGIDERNLTDIVNIIVVSDHGMATTSNKRLVQLEDLIDTSLIEHMDGWPLYGLRPFDTSEMNIVKLYNDLLAQSTKPRYHNAFKVYMRDKNMPAKYHFSRNPRIAPLWLVPEAGWAIVTKDEFDIADSTGTNSIDGVYRPKGLHGYDHEHPLMRAMFVARGPAFPHEEGSRVEEFQNTEVYNIVCDSLGIEPKPNNGSLRLPFKTKGKHDFESPVDIPIDPQDDEEEVELEDENLNNLLLPPDIPVTPPAPAEPATASASALTPTHPEETDGVEDPNATPRPSPPKAPERPVVHDDADEGEEGDFNLWAEWIQGKLDGIKDWAKEVFGMDGEEEEDGKGGMEDGGKEEKGGKKDGG